jgi:hypothetical protein
MRTANSLGSDEQRQVSDTALPNVLGRQRTISNYRPSSLLLSARAPAICREQSEATINDALAIVDRRRIWDPAIVSGSSPTENPIGFDKPRAILKIP